MNKVNETLWRELQWVWWVHFTPWGCKVGRQHEANLPGQHLFPSSFPLFLLGPLVPLVYLNCVFLAEFHLHKYFQKMSWVYIRYQSVGGATGPHFSGVPAGNVSPASLLQPERVHLWAKACIVGLWAGDLPLRVCVFIRELRASFSLMSTLSTELCL